MRIGSTEHYGWDDWYVVTTRHVFSADETGESSYAWLEGPRGPRGDAISVLVTARTPPRGWRAPAAGQRVDVWAWPVPDDRAQAWSAALADGRQPDWRDPGTPQQWLQLRGDAAEAAAVPHPLERARMFRGLTFRGRPSDGRADAGVDQEVTTLEGVATSADLRVATRNFERAHLWCVLGDEGRVVEEKPGLAAMREVFFLPGTRFRMLTAWQDRVGGHLLDVVLVHQLDTVRSSDAPPFLEAERVPALVRALAERALAEPALRVRDPGRFTGPLG